MFKVLRNGIQYKSVCCTYTSTKMFCNKASEITYPKRIFSGIQPTGNIHLGNYLGAVQQWVELQNSNEEILLSVVDMHSITLPHDPKELHKNIFNVTATLLACGIDPKKCILFQQSSVPMHAELCWVLGCITTMARLAHLPQFKEKSESLKNIPLGIYIYPVLQAADILLYRATHVPVGEDQRKHIQLAQDLATMFNRKFGETFPIPHTMINDKLSQRIKSLREPSKKMSKSANDPKSRIELMDEPDVLLGKMKKAVTDCTSKVAFDPENRPGVANLITIHSSLTGKSPDQICQEVQGLDTGEYKLVIADVVSEKLRPIREECKRLLNEPAYIEEVLREGKERATEIAVNCWYDVKNKVGFGNGVIKHTAHSF